MLDVFRKIDNILSSHSFSLEEDINKNASLILADMEDGLNKRGLDELSSSSLAMLPTSFNPFIAREKTLSNTQNVIVIDLGGSNLRRALLSFDTEGKAIISNESISTTFTKEKFDDYKDFFSSIAKYIAPFKGLSKKISFCFSYEASFLEDGGAIALSLSKDFNVPNLKGKNIKTELYSTLLREGWEEDINIFLLNDTLATLAASLYIKTPPPSSYIALVLGTGLNVAYTEQTSANYKKDPRCIILEAGGFDKINMSYFDKMGIAQTKEGEHHILEKMCSARYIGVLAKNIMKKLGEERLFSHKVASFFINDSFSSLDSLWKGFNDFLLKENKSSLSLCNLNVSLEEKDKNIIEYVLSLIISRTTNILLSLILACYKKNEGTLQKDKPLFIMVEGSTVLKTHKMLSFLKDGLHEHISRAYSIPFILEKLKNSTLIGSAIAIH